jgi:hypothetical protein
VYVATTESLFGGKARISFGGVYEKQLNILFSSKTKFTFSPWNRKTITQ